MCTYAYVLSGKKCTHAPKSNFDKMKFILDPLVHIMHTVPSYTHQSHWWCRKHIDRAAWRLLHWQLNSEFWNDVKQNKYAYLYSHYLYETHMESSASPIASTKSHRQLSVWPNTTHQVQQVIGEPNTKR